MNASTLTRPERRTIAVWLIIALIGLGVSLRYHEAAFPSASIDFRITRDEAGAAAAAFLKQQGYDPAPYRSVTIFDYDDDAKVYLERELGLGTANRLMRSQVTVWRWKTRFVRPLQQEEFTVSLSPSGRLVGFDHEIEERRAGVNLTKPQAQTIAERFLVARQSINLAGYRLVEGETKTRDRRTDHTFTWERTNFKAKAATARVSVAVQGDRVGGYEEYLKIPEAWQREYARLRSRNELMQRIAEAVFVGLLIALLVVFVIELTRRRITWRFGFQGGAALAVATIALTVNNLPLAFADYQTTQSLANFYGREVFLALVGAGVWLLAITLIGATGVSVYRRTFPDKIAPESLLTGRALRSKEYGLASIVGYLIPVVMLGYVTAFYLIGVRFGVWSPADIEHTDAVSTSLPWLYPLTIGLQAAIFEEFIFRLFAIPFLIQRLKSPFLAVLLSSVSWAFLHSNYPQQPFFIRGMEITVVGMILGYAFIRYGILSSLIAHYAFDALVIGLFLFQSSRLYFQVAGGIVVGMMLIPFIPSAVALVRRRFEADPSILNETVERRLIESQPVIPVPEPATAGLPGEPSVQPEPVQAAPVSRRALLVVWGLAAVSVGVIALVPVERFLDFVDVRVDRAQALKLAEESLTRRGVKTDRFRRVANFYVVTQDDDDRLAIRYIRRAVGLAGLNRLYRTRLDPAAWQVRFFIPLQKEEYRVFVGVNGAILGYDHRIDEKAPGGNLSQDAALAAARDSLRTRGVDLRPYRLVEANQEKRDARTDYTFVWEDSTVAIREGKFRVRTTVQGNEVVRDAVFFKPPEAWVREERKTTLKDLIITGLLVLVSAGVVVVALRLFIQWIRQRQVEWRFSLKAAAVVAVAGLLEQANNLSTLYAAYNTTQSLQSFLVQAVIGFVLGMAGLVLAGTVLIGFVEAFYRTMFPDRPGLRTWFRSVFRLDTPSARATVRSALLLSYAACVLQPGFHQLIGAGEQWLGLNVGRTATGVPFATSYVPWISAVLSAGADAVMDGAVLLVLILLARQYLRRPPVMAGVLGLLVILQQAGAARTWMEFGTTGVERLLAVGVVWLAVTTVWRENFLAYVLTIFLTRLTGSGWAMITGSTGAYRMAGMWVLILAAVPVVMWGVMSVRMRVRGVREETTGG